MKNFNLPNFVDSWALAKKAFLFFSENKDLNVFPLLSLLVTASLCLGLYSLFPHPAMVLNNIPGFLTIALLVYLIFAFAITYLNTALMAIILKRLNHQTASLAYGFKAANQNLLAILMWSSFRYTLGWLFSLVEDGQNIVKKLSNRSIGFSWSIATYFVLPIMIHDHMSPFQAMQRSLETVGRGYKNTVSVRVIITIIFIFFFFIISEFILAYPMITAFFLVKILPCFLIAFFIAETLETILVGALFLNLIRSGPPKYFDPTLLARAFEKEE